MDKKTAISIIRQFAGVFESKKEFEWLVEAMIFIDKLVEDQQKEIEEKNIAINKMSKDISSQLEEIEEKRTIIFAGAEKVKQLEKGNRSLMESRIKWKNRYYKEKSKNKNKIVDLETKLAIETIDNKYNQEERDEETIPRYKIREKIKSFQDVKKEIIKNENKLLRASITYDIIRNDYCEKMLQELLEEN